MFVSRHFFAYHMLRYFTSVYMQFNQQPHIIFNLVCLKVYVLLGLLGLIEQSILFNRLFDYLQANTLIVTHLYYLLFHILNSYEILLVVSNL